jgi:hypothetical protein
MNGALTHDGDRLVKYERKGVFDVTLKLKDLSDDIAFIYILSSACDGSSFGDITQPRVEVHSRQHSRALCKFELSEATCSGPYMGSCAIMARLYRDGDGWVMQSIGLTLPQGDGSDYVPLDRAIRLDIANGFNPRRSLAPATYPNSLDTLSQMYRSTPAGHNLKGNNMDMLEAEVQENEEAAARLAKSLASKKPDGKTRGKKSNSKKALQQSPRRTPAEELQMTLGAVTNQRAV